MPQNLQDWLPQDHLARFVVDLVGTLDLSAITAAFARSVRGGRPAYHPQMMVGLLLYGYTVGICSSRKIEQFTYERIDFRIVSGDQHPDHDSIAQFRKQHLPALADLFVQVLQICHTSGLVKLEHAALDGTKMMANAAKGNTRSARALLAEEKRLKDQMNEQARARRQAQRILEEAERIDAAEDELYGPGHSGYELPEELRDPAKRLAFIQEAVARLKQEAKERAQQEQGEAEQKAREHEAKNKKGKKPSVPDAAQRELELMQSDALRTNLTDPDSRLMRDGATKAIVQGYNAQAVVDKERQIIVAADVTQDENDKHQLAAMVLQVQENLGRLPEEVSADTGYFSQSQITDARLQGVDLLVPPDRACTQCETDPNALQRLKPEHTGPIEWYREEPTCAETMAAKLRTPDGRERYSARGQTVEPVFGQTKQARGLRRFLLRGIQSVRCEWRLMCLGHNISKLFRSQAPPTRPPHCPRRPSCTAPVAQLSLC